MQTSGVMPRGAMRRRHLTETLALGLVVILAVGACGSSASPSPTGTASTGPGSTATASTGPSASTSANATKKTIAYLNADAVVSRWVFDEKGFKDEAAALGDDAVVVEAGGNVQTQTTQVESMITRQVDAMVITPVDVGTAASLFAKADAANIPSVNYNFIVPNIKPAYIVAQQAHLMGVTAATMALKDHPTGNYVIVSGDAAQSVARDETSGYMEVLQPQIDAGKITLVSQKFNASWSPQGAQAQVEAALVKTNNKIEAVLSNNDAMAIAVMAALKPAGLLGKTFISGLDCDQPNLQAIAEKNQVVCMWTDFYEMGREAAQAADAAARGTKLSLPDLKDQPNGNVTVPTVMMPVIAVTNDILCSWLKQYQWVSPDKVYVNVPAPSC